MLRGLSVLCNKIAMTRYVLRLHMYLYLISFSSFALLLLIFRTLWTILPTVWRIPLFANSTNCKPMELGQPF